MSNPALIEVRAQHSRDRLTELRNGITEISVLEEFPSLTIYAVGSYARLEASEHSDIDLFFLTADNLRDIDDPRTKSLRIFSAIIELADGLHFPKFSNDCEYLRLISAKDILDHIGHPEDDHRNFFTARMLLLLESHCLHNEPTMDRITQSIISSYFRDYPDHQETFWPLFLLNDIGRFWKTLLLNYEHKRLQHTTDPPPEHIKTKQRVRNFKLKFSRLTTCFASIVALGSHAVPVTEDAVFDVIKLNPRARLNLVKEQIPSVSESVDRVLEQYAWFLEMTGLSTEDLEDKFANKEKRQAMFGRAIEYGDTVFDLLQKIDGSNEELKLLRFLVV